VPLEDINRIFGSQHVELRAKDTTEAAALLFAQHYAENLDQLDPESVESLRSHYSDAQVAEIIAYVRAITLGNLTGNTLDAIFDHLLRRGHAEREDTGGSTLARGPAASSQGDGGFDPAGMSKLRMSAAPKAAHAQPATTDRVPS
jgi:hypothetical protein